MGHTLVTFFSLPPLDSPAHSVCRESVSYGSKPPPPLPRSPSRASGKQPAGSSSSTGPCSFSHGLGYVCRENNAGVKAVGDDDDDAGGIVFPREREKIF